MNLFVLLCYTCNRLSSLDVAIQEIFFEEKHVGIIPSKQSEVVLVSTHSTNMSWTTFCKNYNIFGHKFSDCPKIECRYCHNRGHILDNYPPQSPRLPGYPTKSKNSTKPRLSLIIIDASSNDDSPLSRQISDLQDLLKQLISSTSSALVVSPGNRWLLNSACCNHMAYDLSHAYTYSCNIISPHLCS